MGWNRPAFLFFASLLIISTIFACKKEKIPLIPLNLTNTPTQTGAPTGISTAASTPTVTRTHTQTPSPTFTGTIPPTPELVGEILYSCPNTAFGSSICKMNPDGTGAVTIISDPDVRNRAGKWNSDKSKIVYWHGADNLGNIFVMDSNGANATQLTSYSGFENAVGPIWSPDDSKIAYTVLYNGSLACTIHVMNSDGTGDTEIIPLGTNGGNFDQWISNSRILFSDLWVQSGEYRIYEMDLDGSNLVQLIDDTGFGDAVGKWNPSKTKLAFSRYPPSSSEYHMMSDLWIFNGSSIQGITNTPYCYEDYLVWSPNGAYLAYRKGGLDCTYSIYRMQADGTYETALGVGTPSDWR